MKINSCLAPLLAVSASLSMAQYGQPANVSVAQQFDHLQNTDRQLAADINSVERRVDVLEGQPNPSPNPHNQLTRYTVKYGDTLSSISRTLGVPLETVKQANGGKSTIYVDQVLVLNQGGYAPAPAPTPAPQPAPQPPVSQFGEYQVVQGDTLSGIARRYGTTISAIRGANGLRGDVIQVNQVLRIPGQSLNHTNDRPVEPTPQPWSDSRTYQVQRGDTLSGIARRYGVTVQELASHNRLSNLDSLSVGQALRVPSPTGTTGGYREYQTSQLSPQVPVSRTMAPAPVYEAPAPVKFEYQGSILSYRVKADDTLETIAQTFMTTPENVTGLNGLRAGERPATGSLIKVPTPSYLEAGGYRS